MTFGIGHNSGPQFETIEEMVVAAAEALRPSARITVSEAAERYHIVKNPGQHEGPFSLDKTPYLREPMDVLTSLDFTGMAFAGPARTGKSAMAINWLCHTAITDPADMMIVHMAQHTARDWSKADLAKAIRNSPELQKRLKPTPDADNVFDKEFLSGMRTIVTWPTVSNLSGKTIPRLWIMDMDRIKPQIIEKEGHVFDLTRKRAGTFKRYGMTAPKRRPASRSQTRNGSRVKMLRMRLRHVKAFCRYTTAATGVDGTGRARTATESSSPTSTCCGGRHSTLATSWKWPSRRR